MLMFLKLDWLLPDVRASWQFQPTMCSTVPINLHQYVTI